MNKQQFSLLDVELYFPLDFLSKAVAHAEYDPKSVIGWDASNVGNANSLKILSSKIGHKLKLRYDCLHFRFENDTYICDIDDTLISESLRSADKTAAIQNNHERGQFECGDNEKQIQTFVSIPLSYDNSKQPQDKICPRKKRGRPRKNQITGQDSKGLKETPESISDIKNNVNTSSFEVCSNTVKNEPKEEELKKGKGFHRYGLRGVKLNSDIMGAVKKSYFHADDYEEDDKTSLLNDDNDNDADYVRKQRSIPECDSDAEHNGEKNKKTKKSVLAKTIPKIERRQRRISNIECKICKRRVTDYTGVYYHVKKKHARKKGAADYLEELKKLMVEICPICGITCSDRKKLMMHEDREHSKSGPVKCNECNKTFKNIPTLKTHLQWMHLKEPEAKRHLCHLCTASFKSSTTLKHHIDQIHYGNKYNQCDLCKKKFYNKSQLRRHQRIHSLDESQKYPCTVCGKRFIFAYNLKKHIMAVHSDHKENFHCSYCGKGFGQKHGMISHIQLVHFNIFPFSCKECKATFSRSSGFVEHMKSYHKQADFRITETLVKNGKYNKSAEDMYYCSYCSEGFIHIAKLVVHMHSDHSDAFPFRCETCNQGYLERIFLSVHKMRAHGVILSDDVNDDSEKENNKIHEILQVITEKEGYPNKLVQLGSKEHDQDGEELAEVQSLVEQSGMPEMGGQGSSLLIEVASGGTTSRYVIEAPDILDDSGSVNVAHDIASLLLAAEQTMQEDAEVTQSDGTTQINLVLEGDNTTFVSSDNTYVGQGHNETVEETSALEEYSGEIITEESSSMEIQVQNADGEIQVVTVPTAGNSRLTLDGELLEFAAMETVSNDTMETVTNDAMVTVTTDVMETVTTDTIETVTKADTQQTAVIEADLHV